MRPNSFASRARISAARQTRRLDRVAGDGQNRGIVGAAVDLALARKLLVARAVVLLLRHGDEIAEALGAGLALLGVGEPAAPLARRRRAAAAARARRCSPADRAAVVLRASSSLRRRSSSLQTCWSRLVEACAGGSRCCAISSRDSWNGPSPGLIGALDLMRSTRRPKRRTRLPVPTHNRRSRCASRSISFSSRLPRAGSSA